MTVGLPPGMMGGAVTPAPAPVGAALLPPPAGAAPITVTQVSGTVIEVLTAEEKTFFESIRDRYCSENIFTAVTDMQDLDRLLVMELLVHRWTSWLSKQRDYNNILVDDVDLRRALKDYSTQITAVKLSMGLSKAERERDQHDSVGAYIVQLKQAGKHFVVHRLTQAAKSIALMQEAKSLCGTYRRCNDVERQKLGLTAEDIVDWINNVAGPEIDQIDLDFRKNQQRYWTIG